MQGETIWSLCRLYLLACGCCCRNNGQASTRLCLINLWCFYFVLFSCFSRTHSATRSHYSCKTATQILMTWIEEHPDNPYPNRDEKKRLAKRACMTVKQLGDWFGNARRRRKRLVQDELHMAKRAREMQLAAVGAS